MMRFLPLLALLFGGCAAVKSVGLPWNSRTKEQARLNAAVSPKPENREAEILRPDVTKSFDPRAANFGSARSFRTTAARTNEFYLVDKTRTKSFATREFGTKGAWGANTGYATKEAPTKESWFSKLTARTKSYPTRENWEAGKKSETRALPGGDRAFFAKGRRQAALDKDGAAGQAIGGDRLGGQSWSGDLKPLTIEDVKTLLNKR